MKHSGLRFGTLKNACRMTGFLTCLSLLILVTNSSEAKEKNDTLFLKKGTPVYILQNIIILEKDTILIKKNYARGDVESSRIFYDSVHSKFQKSKFTRYLYTLAFLRPKQSGVSDTAQVIKSESPFLPYKGKIVRNIRVVTLDPFGYSVYDTTKEIKTLVGKFLNSVHRSTHVFVIRKNLQIKKGQKVDPDAFADNERYLRSLSYINEIRTIVNNVENTDSVDVEIITQDVWSIGFDFITITPSKLRMRLYDANFLGTGDRLNINFSTDINRGPFFLLDGASYRFNNLWGSFVDAYVSFTQSIDGNQSIIAAAERSFYSNRTEWAGGALFEYRKWVSEDIPPKTAFLNRQSLWAGHAWFLEKENRPTRLVAIGAMNRVAYDSRPEVSIDSNRVYYNSTQIFPGIAYSRNNFYISDYLVEFGKTENIPYGNLFQINAGPEMTDFYKRFYAGFEFAGGNYFRKFGYLSLTLKGGGYYYRNNLEDEVLKVTTRYITPVLVSARQRYKFRSFFVTDFRMAFNQRSNNEDNFNINKNFEIDNYISDSIFDANKSLSLTLSSVLYTPWYFYGFKFALVAQIQGGWWAPKEEKLFNQPFYFGSGIGIMTKNNNLIFPTIIFSLYYYPEIIQGIPSWQFRFIPDVALRLPDFNPRIPGAETMQN